MNTPDIGPLVKGIMTVIGIVIAMGQYSNLERWARIQAAEALMWKQPLPYFFAPVHHQQCEGRRRRGRESLSIAYTGYAMVCFECKNT
jgi:hypothetical protein